MQTKKKNKQISIRAPKQEADSFDPSELDGKLFLKYMLIIYGKDAFKKKAHTIKAQKKTKS